MTHYTLSRWRLLLTEPTDGATNMAIDEAIMFAVGAGESPPTLRFFAWTPPCLSLGHAQPLADADLDRIAALGYGLVRRPTGGRAILHTDELTYSLSAPQSDPRVAGGVVESYRRLSEGLMRGLVLLGLEARNDRLFTTENTESTEKTRNSVNSVLSVVKDNPVCFITPSNYEITANGKKLIGSAQARKQGAVLQHGSMPLAGDIARICGVLAYASEEERAAATARVRERATTLESVLGRVVRWKEVADALTSGLGEALALDLEPAPLTTAECNQAEELRESKYSMTR